MPYIEGRVVHDADAHIMETPTWLRDHADPDDPRPHRAARPGERQRAAADRRPRGAAPRPRRRVRQARAPSMRRTSTAPTRPPRSCSARTSRRRARSSPRTARGRSTCSAFASQLVFNTFHNRRLRNWEHGTDLDLAVRRGPGAQPRDARLLLGRPPPAARPATSRSPTSTARAAMADEALAHGRGRRCSSRRAARRTTRPATSRSTRCGRARRRRASRSCSTSAAPATCSTPRTSRTACPIPPDFHGGEENFRSVDYMAIPHPADADAGDDDLRRRARALPRAADRRDRAGRDLDAVVDAADGVRVRRVRPPRGAAAERCRCARASTCGGRCGRRRTRPRTSAGSSSRPGPRSACSRRTTRTSRAAGSRSSGSRRSLGDASDEVRQAFYCDNFIDLMGSALASLAACLRRRYTARTAKVWRSSATTSSKNSSR